MGNRSLILALSTVLSISLSCSEFNNPINPTYPLKCYYSLNNIEIAVYPTKVILYSLGPLTPPDKEYPLTVIYLKTDTDFSKIFPSLNNKNSNFIYTVFLDTVIDSVGINGIFTYQTYHYRIVLSSPEKETSDTNFFQTRYSGFIEIYLNNIFMNNPKQFLWQAKLNLMETYLLPPKPYAYIYTRSNLLYKN